MADVTTLAQIMNWGQKCKKARVQKFRFYEKVCLSMLSRMGSLSGSRGITQKPVLAGGPDCVAIADMARL